MPMLSTSISRRRTFVTIIAGGIRLLCTLGAIRCWPSKKRLITCFVTDGALMMLHVRGVDQIRFASVTIGNDCPLTRTALFSLGKPRARDSVGILPTIVELAPGLAVVNTVSQEGSKVENGKSHNRDHSSAQSSSDHVCTLQILRESSDNGQSAIRRFASGPGSRRAALPRSPAE